MLPFESSVIVKGYLDRKKIAKSLDFVENGNFFRVSTEAGFCLCSTENLQENFRGGVLF